MRKVSRDLRGSRKIFEIFSIFQTLAVKGEVPRLLHRVAVLKRFLTSLFPDTKLPRLNLRANHLAAPASVAKCSSSAVFAVAVADSTRREVTARDLKGIVLTFLYCVSLTHSVSIFRPK